MISKNKVKYVRSLEMKKFRKADAVFVAEGYKLVGDLLDVFECVYLVATAEWISTYDVWVRKLKNRGIEVDEVTEDELKRVSFQETPQQVLAVFKQPVYEVDVNVVAKKELCLMLDDVQNPGNLGTIVRLADWFGIEHIFCSKGCADIYNPKTVQATMGGLARVQVHYVDLVEMLRGLETGIPVYGTFLDGENMYQKKLGNKGLIVMGNEGKGVSKDVEAFVSERLYIPNYPEGHETSESLNVAIATAIVCAEFRRR
ncbi:MAG: RNA methyltransferase [Bacteroidaceae bacterium]|nr:RNA methyltransferase [Bacteroidaceae bacterium]